MDSPISFQPLIYIRTNTWKKYTTINTPQTGTAQSLDRQLHTNYNGNLNWNAQVLSPYYVLPWENTSTPSVSSLYDNETVTAQITQESSPLCNVPTNELRKHRHALQSLLQQNTKRMVGWYFLSGAVVRRRHSGTVITITIASTTWIAWLCMCNDTSATGRNGFIRSSLTQLFLKPNLTHCDAYSNLST